MEEFQKPYEELEGNEKIVRKLEHIESDIIRIRNNVVFFFTITVIALSIGLIVLVGIILNSI